jgi:hypothetical protein
LRPELLSWRHLLGETLCFSNDCLILRTIFRN